MIKQHERQQADRQRSMNKSTSIDEGRSGFCSLTACVGHPTPANLSEWLARTDDSGDRTPPTVTNHCRGPRLVHFAAAAKRPAPDVMPKLIKEDGRGSPATGQDRS